MKLCTIPLLVMSICRFILQLSEYETGWWNAATPPNIRSRVTQPGHEKHTRASKKLSYTSRMTVNINLYSADPRFESRTQVYLLARL